MDPGNGFLKKYVSLLPFPLCLAESRQVSRTLAMILDLNNLWTPTALAHSKKSMGLHRLVQESQPESDDVRSELLSAILGCRRVLEK